MGSCWSWQCERRSSRRSSRRLSCRMKGGRKVSRKCLTENMWFLYKFLICDFWYRISSEIQIRHFWKLIQSRCVDSVGMHDIDECNRFQSNCIFLSGQVVVKLELTLKERNRMNYTPEYHRKILYIKRCDRNYRVEHTKLINEHTHTHTHTHIYIYIYIYIIHTHVYIYIYIHVCVFW